MVESERPFSSELRIEDPEWKVRFIQKMPNSVLTTTEAINREFGAGLIDEILLTQIVNVDSSVPGIPKITLNSLWEGVELLPSQERMIANFFGRIIYSGKKTLGEVRELTKSKRIRKIAGLGRVSDIWFADSFRKAEVDYGK